MPVLLALGILLSKRKRKVKMDEVILPRDRAECLVRELKEILDNPRVYEVKISFTREEIRLIPFFEAVSIRR